MADTDTLRRRLAQKTAECVSVRQGYKDILHSHDLSQKSAKSLRDAKMNLERLLKTKLQERDARIEQLRDQVSKTQKQNDIVLQRCIVLEKDYTDQVGCNCLSMLFLDSPNYRPVQQPIRTPSELRWSTIWQLQTQS